jgi:hypothetical protein
MAGERGKLKIARKLGIIFPALHFSPMVYNTGLRFAWPVFA